MLPDVITRFFELGIYSTHVQVDSVNGLPVAKSAACECQPIYVSRVGNDFYLLQEL